MVFCLLPLPTTFWLFLDPVLWLWQTSSVRHRLGPRQRKAGSFPRTGASHEFILDKHWTLLWQRGDASLSIWDAKYQNKLSAHLLRSAIRDFLAFYYVPVHGPEATAITVTKMGRPVCLIVWLKFAVGQKGRDRKIKYVLYSIVTNAMKNKQKERKEGRR